MQQARWFFSSVGVAKLEPIKHPSMWGGVRLHGGILVEHGGFLVTDRLDGTLRIDDPRSDYDRMPAWMFKSRGYKVLHWEFDHRKKIALDAAKREKRSTADIHIPWPQPPKWNKEADEISYPGYDQKTVAKALKQVQQ